MARRRKPIRKRFAVYAIEEQPTLNSLGHERGTWQPTGETFIAELETLGGRDFEFARQLAQDCTHRICFRHRIPRCLNRRSRLMIVDQCGTFVDVCHINYQKRSVLVREEV